MQDPTDILDPTMQEAKRVLIEMRSTKDLARRKELSEILKNLCESVGVFFNFMTATMRANDFPDDDDDDDDISDLF
jgi:hypothetical protein